MKLLKFKRKRRPPVIGRIVRNLTALKTIKPVHFQYVGDFIHDLLTAAKKQARQGGQR